MKFCNWSASAPPRGYDSKYEVRDSQHRTKSIPGAKGFIRNMTGKRPVSHYLDSHSPPLWKCGNGYEILLNSEKKPRFNLEISPPVPMRILLIPRWKASYNCFSKLLTFRSIFEKVVPVFPLNYWKNLIRNTHYFLTNSREEKC